MWNGTRLPNRWAIAVWVTMALVVASGCGGSGPSSHENGPTGIAEDVTVQEAEAMIQANQGDPTFVILDVRTPGEFAGGYIEGASNLDYNDSGFAAAIAALDTTRTYLVYCQGGFRSAGAMAQMAQIGFEEVYDMLGGITAWTAAGYPTVTKPAAYAR